MNEVISVFGTQFTASALVVFLGSALEHFYPPAAKWAATAKRAGYWALAAASAAGVHFSFHAGTLAVSGLYLSTITHSVWHWTQSVVLQEFVHRTTKRQAV